MTTLKFNILSLSTKFCGVMGKVKNWPKLHCDIFLIKTIKLKSGNVTPP
jgi:hypothetical protein